MAAMRVKTVREAFPPIFALIGGLVILVSTLVTGYKRKMHLKGGGDIYRATDPEGFRKRQALTYVIAGLLLAYWVFETWVS
jgi:hypothetical protein